MRRMAFSTTVEQMRNQSKTVTRRDPATWVDLKPGDRVLAIEKGMGLPKGARQVVIGEIEIVSNRVERAIDVDLDDVEREGFPAMTPADWLAEVWWELHGPVTPMTEMRRIEFRHVADPESCISGIIHDSE